MVISFCWEKAEKLCVLLTPIVFTHLDKDILDILLTQSKFTFATIYIKVLSFKNAFRRFSSEASLFLYFCILGTLVLWSRSVLSQHIRGTPGAVSATWHESSYASMVYWACWNGIRLNSRLTWCRVDFLHALVAIWCPTGAFRWAKYKFDSSSSPKQIMLKGEWAVRLGHLLPPFPHSSSLSV